MNVAGGFRDTVLRVRDAVDAARDRVSEWMRRDPVFDRMRASEAPEQRRINDRKQRGAEAPWKMQYDGRPDRDPEFRRAERFIYQKRLSHSEEAKLLVPLWVQYHEKYLEECLSRDRDARQGDAETQSREVAPTRAAVRHGREGRVERGDRFGQHNAFRAGDAASRK
jgi:hypothetical protein